MHFWTVYFFLGKKLNFIPIFWFYLYNAETAYLKRHQLERERNTAKIETKKRRRARRRTREREKVITNRTVQRSLSHRRRRGGVGEDSCILAKWDSTQPGRSAWWWLRHDDEDETCVVFLNSCLFYRNFSFFKK